MRKYQFSLACLLFLVAFLGIACAALRNASLAWCLALRAVMLLELLIGGVLCVVGSGPVRVFCRAFVVVAWTQLIFVYMFPFFPSDDGQGLQNPLSVVLDRAWRVVRIEDPSGGGTSGSQLGVPLYHPDQSDFISVGVQIVTMVLATAGGAIAVRSLPPVAETGVENGTASGKRRQPNEKG